MLGQKLGALYYFYLGAKKMNPLLELRLFEPPSPEGVLKKISEQNNSFGIA